MQNQQKITNMNDLTVELKDLVCANLTVADVRAVRLVSRSCAKAGYAYLMITRAFLFDNLQSYKDLEKIARNQTLTAHITTLVVDASLLTQLGSFDEWDRELHHNHHNPVGLDFRLEWPRKRTPPEALTNKAEEAFRTAQKSAAHTTREALDMWQQCGKMQAMQSDGDFLDFKRQTLVTFLSQCQRLAHLVIAPKKRSSAAEKMYTANHGAMWPGDGASNHVFKLDPNLFIHEQAVWSTFLRAAMNAKKRITRLTALDLLPSSPRACPQYLAEASLSDPTAARLSVLLDASSEHSNPEFFGTYLTSAPQLSSLCIRATATRNYNTNSSAGLEISHLLATTTWPRLTHLSLTKISATAEILTAFLLRHGPTLQTLLLEDITLTAGKWATLFSHIAGHLASATRVDIRGLLRTRPRPVSRVLQTEMTAIRPGYFGQWNTRCVFGETLEKYVLSDGLWRFDAWVHHFVHLPKLGEPRKGRVTEPWGDEFDEVFQESCMGLAWRWESGWYVALGSRRWRWKLFMPGALSCA